ncbi:MAG: hypothetical protein NVS2B14_10730 [Chamaesiphon sp.]
MIYWRLNRLDGSWFLVFPPPLSAHAKVAAYYQEFRHQLAGFKAWPPEIDAELYSYFSEYYQAIADTLVPKFSPSLLDPLSRHQFFVATEPHAGIPGLSGLEQLLGMSPIPVLDSEKGASPPKAELTTGNTILDVMTALSLTFKSNALPLAETYDMRSLSKMVSYASDLMRGEEVLKERQQQLDKEFFEKHQAEIDKQMRKMGGATFFN